MMNNLHLHVPYQHLAARMNFILERKINPEIFFSAGSLERAEKREIAALADTIRSASLPATIHAPFLDLNPGAIDPTIREATKKRFMQLFEIAEIFRPRVIVFHPGFDELRYGDNRKAWLDNSIAFWGEFIPLAEELGTVIAIENIFEKEPSTLLELLSAIDNPLFRHCFDTGHWNMFATVTLEEWFELLGGFIAEAHIHDNHGTADEHLPVGEGDIDFGRFFSLLGRYAPDAVRTVELHTLDRIERGLRSVARFIPLKATFPDGN